MSKERPILFSAPMVRALLDGRKTQTRRLLHHGDRAMLAEMFGESADDISIMGGDGHSGPGWYAASSEYPEEGSEKLREPCAVGDTLWVRETFGEYVEVIEKPYGPRYCYRATDDMQFPVKWHPSIHMPRAASRLTLRVTSVRVERVQDITEADAEAEGAMNTAGDRSWRMGGPEAPGSWWGSPREAFRDAWVRIYGAESWDASPCVWVVSLERVAQEPARAA